MRTSIFKFFLAALILLVVMPSCKDDRNNFMVDDSILFKVPQSGSLVRVPIPADGYQAVVLKSGKGQAAAMAQITISEEDLAMYNEENGTSYVLLPSSHYTLSRTEISFPKKHSANGEVVMVTWDSQDLSLLGDNFDYVIPLKLSVINDELEVPEELDVLFIHPYWSYIKFPTSQTQKLRPNALHDEEGIYNSEILIDAPVPNLDLTVNCELDYSLIDAFNQQNGTNYLAPPAKYNVRLANPSPVLAAGEEAVPVRLHFDTSPMFVNGQLDISQLDRNEYLIPMRIKSISAYGVKIENDIIYVPVNMFGEVKGPWTVLEGAEHSVIYDPNEHGPWTASFPTENLFDGNINTEWISWWETEIPFPLAFVVDMHKPSVFTKFIISDHLDFSQGNLRNYDIYTAVKYEGESTDWKLVASGLRDFVQGTKSYDYPVQAMIPGRYLKFVILNAQSYDPNSEQRRGRGKLSEVCGEGF